MKTAAIISEFNPFHNGHEYLIRTLKEKHGFDHVVIIMSGNYVQRGEPAVFDKYTRASHALMAGADLVVEMPVIFATSSAREFATCGVKIAAALGIVDTLAFGVEDGVTLTELNALSEAVHNVNDDIIKELLSQGKTYPEALGLSCGLNAPLSSNNILAVEYIDALKGTGIGALPIGRLGDGYSSEEITHSRFASAMSLRRLIAKNGDISPYVPSYTLGGDGGDFVYTGSPSGSVTHTATHTPTITTPDMMSAILSAALLKEDDFTRYLDISREISDRLINRRNTIMSFTDRVDDTKTRQFTRSRISRALLHIILGITREEFEVAKANGYVSSIRILGLRKDSGISSELKEKAALPVISRTAQYKDLLSRDIYFDQLYYSLTASKGEFERTPIIYPVTDFLI
ncbi:MAG: nucleotidyltransferase family protein [Eubacteriales bacterium]|nr:nucleotidyltransferase family protein [Eubacteriales bacterium]